MIVNVRTVLRDRELSWVSLWLCSVNMKERTVLLDLESDCDRVDCFP